MEEDQPNNPIYALLLSKVNLPRELGGLGDLGTRRLLFYGRLLPSMVVAPLYGPHQPGLVVAPLLWSSPVGLGDLGTRRLLFYGRPLPSMVVAPLYGPHQPGLVVSPLLWSSPACVALMCTHTFCGL